MKNKPLPTSSQSSTGLRGLFNQLFGRSGMERTHKTRTVQVWDARSDSYRNVDLHDRNDPLWPTARELYLLSKHSPRKTAA